MLLYGRNVSKHIWNNSFTKNCCIIKIKQLDYKLMSKIGLKNTLYKMALFVFVWIWNKNFNVDKITNRIITHENIKVFAWY